MTLNLSLFLTAVHVLWTLYWGLTYRRLRRGRNYSSGRELKHTNRRYKFIGYATFFTHNFIAIFAYWSDSTWLLKLFHSTEAQLSGVVLLIAGSVFHAWAIKHLVSNYSPCFDAHLPKDLVTTGPYARIRHPDYLAKMIVSFALVLMTESAWALALFLWLAVEMYQTTKKEEKILVESLPGYQEYKSRTSKWIPGIY